MSMYDSDQRINSKWDNIHFDRGQPSLGPIVSYLIDPFLRFEHFFGEKCNKSRADLEKLER